MPSSDSFFQRASLRTCLMVGVVAALWAAVSGSDVRAQQVDATGLQLAAAMERLLVDAIAQAERSVVAIARVKSGDAPPVANLGGRPDLFDRFRPRRGTPDDPDFIPNEYGTGVVVDRRGLILTQYHVVKPGDDHWVTTADRKVHRAKIRAADPRSGLAILSVEANDLVPMRFADVSNLRKGHLVIALGNPYAIARDGQVSASWGIISNLARKAGPIPSDDPAGQRATLHHFGTLIQTDAKLNLGTSGGALVNLRGEMVGLTTALAAGAGYEMAAGYAVPMDQAIRRVIEVLKEGREVEYGLLGVVTENLLADELRRGVQGMRVRQIVEGTPADRVGLKPGDIITHVNRRAIYDADGLVLEVGKQAAEARIQLTVLGRRQPIEVQLAKLRVQGEKIITNRPPDWRGVRVDHATAVEGFQAHARMGHVDMKGCVAVVEVQRDSPAWQAGLRPRMFISHVGTGRVARPQDFRDAVAQLDGSVRIRLTLPENQSPVRTIAADE